MSSGIRFLALFGVPVQVGVILVESINQLRVRGDTILDGAMEGGSQAPSDNERDVRYLGLN